MVIHQAIVMQMETLKRTKYFRGKRKPQYGEQIAHADPDHREEFNCHDNADWH